jgi:hypothetical protein
LRNHHVTRAELALRQKDHAEAARSAAELPRLFPDRGPDYVRAAEIITRALPLAATEEAGRELTDQAVNFLREAPRRPYPDPALLRRHADAVAKGAFAALKRHPDYDEVLRAWEAVPKP